MRSLAVAFGDGLAFGVGMKLSQKAARNIEAPSSEISRAVDLSPVLDRLEAIEKRVGTVERTPLSIGAPASPVTSSSFDQKVLEAIVKALDARLLEQAGQVERRLTELEARMAIELRSLQQQDHSVVSRVQSHIEELNGQFNDQLAAIRRRSDEERAAMQREFAEQAAQAVENRATELRQEIASRDSQIAELRARLEAGNESLRNVASAIAQACQSVAPRTEPAAKIEAGAAPVPLVSLQ